MPENLMIKVRDLFFAYVGAAAGLAAAAGPNVLSPISQDYEKLSPFEALRWNGDRPEVRLKDAWYGLVSIDGLAAPGMLEFSKHTWPSIWRKRFSEDLVEVMARMGHRPGRAVDLIVRDLRTGATRELTGVPMTEDNRWALWKANRRSESRGRSPERPPAELSGEQIAADLRELRSALETRYSYLHRDPADYVASLLAIERRLAKGARRETFVSEVAVLLARFGDGHTRPGESLESVLPRGYLPFLIEDAALGLVAVRATGRSFVDPDHPYLRSIDGIDVERWIRAARPLVPLGSPQWIRRQSIRSLRLIAHLRRELGRPQRGDIRVGLADASGGSLAELSLPVASRKPLYGEWPRTSSRILPGVVGYLRIARMEGSPAFLDSLHRTMRSFAETRGLIIDVRGNGGGTRDALLTLFPYLMRPTDRPHVANIAAYRLRPDDRRDLAAGYLANRYLFPATSSIWSAAERAAIRDAAESFRPEWEPPPDDFSAWHYLVLSRGDDPRVYSYRRPVVVLMDAGCFSATDIFLGALAGWRDVTLLGLASGGGSGRSQPVRLRHSGLEVRLSSMASFRPNGRLYDGRGIEPDRVVHPIATDFTGATDTMLDAALEIISSERRARGDG